MKRIKKKRLYFVSGLALVMLLVLPVWKLMTYVVADQTTGTIVNANLTLARSITNAAGESVTGSIIQGETYNLRYTLTPQPVHSATTPSVLKQNVSKILFKELIPADITVLTEALPAEFKIDENSGLLSGPIPDIPYTWDSASMSFIADHDANETQKVISLVIPFKVTLNGESSPSKEIIFNNATLTYTDLHSSNNSTPVTTATPTPTPSSTFDPSVSASGSSFGVAGDYTFFIFGKSKILGGLSGTLASGGDTIVGSSQKGASVNESQKSVPYALVTGGNLEFPHGTIYGKVYVKGSFTKVNQGDIKGTYSFSGSRNGDQTSIIDFEKTKAYILAKSAELGSLPVNGTATVQNNDQLNLNGTDPKLNVFLISSKASMGDKKINLSAIKGIIVNVPPNSTTIINIDEPTVVMNMWNGNTSDSTRTIYNFPQTTNLSLSSSRYGTILAPKALVKATNGSLKGSLIADSLDFDGLGVESAPFATAVPTAAPTATPAPTPAPTMPPTVPITFPVLEPVTVVDPVDNTPRTLTLQGESIVKLGTKADLKAIYTGPATEKDITYTWIITQDGKDVTASKLKNGSDNSQKELDTSQVGDYKITVKVNSSNLKVETIAEKMISVRSLTIDGPDNIFVTKTKDFVLTTGNIPANSEIKWSITKSDEQYATLLKDSTDTTNTKYTLTGNQIHNGVVITVEAGGITETRTVNIIPFSLTGLSAVGEIEINVGQTLNLNTLLYATPSEMNINDIKNQFSWTSSMPHIANFDSNPTDENRGVIQGLQKGENVLVTVSYLPPGASTPVTATIKVKVNAPPNGDLY